jgi:hypothetical protein
MAMPVYPGAHRVSGKQHCCERIGQTGSGWRDDVPVKDGNMIVMVPFAIK